MVQFQALPNTDRGISSEVSTAESLLNRGAQLPASDRTLVDHPRLQAALRPNTVIGLGIEVQRAINDSVQSLATESPDVVVVGRSLRNRLGGGEKAVLHIDGLDKIDTLTWDRVEPYRAIDALEVVQVAQRIERSLGVSCSPAQALSLMVERMKALLLESALYGYERRVALEATQRLSEREAAFGHKLLARLPAVAQRDQGLRTEITFHQAESLKHAILHDGNCQAEPWRARASMFFGRLDSLWYYRPAEHVRLGTETSREGSSPGKEKVMRINNYSIALASLGIFQKGTGGWDQNYPQSPLQFWIDMVEPYLLRQNRIEQSSPADAQARG